MKKTLLIASIAAITGCATVDKVVFSIDQHPMSAEQRQRFNSAPWAPECVFDETGNAINRDAGIGCSDYRWINRAIPPYRPGINFAGTDNRYVKTPVIDPAEIEAVDIPGDATVVWLDRVSKAEATCAELTTDRWKMQGLEGAEYYNKLAKLEYPPACYDRALSIIYAVYGDKPALEHEIAHHRREIPDSE